jgi:hypothetical protein
MPLASMEISLDTSTLPATPDNADFMNLYGYRNAMDDSCALHCVRWLRGRMTSKLPTEPLADSVT